jgi:ribosomal protein S27AE
MREINATHSVGSVGASLNRRVRCGICGFSEVRTDEVVDRGVLFLAECPRCDHRWTSLEPIAAHSAVEPRLATVHFQRVPARFSREVQPAA